MEEGQQDIENQAKEKDMYWNRLIPTREKFHCNDDAVYLCGNSLGLQPKDARKEVLRELDVWERDGVEGHFPKEGEDRLLAWVNASGELCWVAF